MLIQLHPRIFFGSNSIKPGSDRRMRRRRRRRRRRMTLEWQVGINGTVSMCGKGSSQLRHARKSRTVQPKKGKFRPDANRSARQGSPRNSCRPQAPVSVHIGLLLACSQADPHGYTVGRSIWIKAREEPAYSWSSKTRRRSPAKRPNRPHVAQHRNPCFVKVSKLRL